VELVPLLEDFDGSRNFPGRGFHVNDAPVKQPLILTFHFRRVLKRYPFTLKFETAPTSSPSRLRTQ